MTATLAPEKYDEVQEALKDVMDPEPVSYTHLTLPTILLV